MGTCCFDLTPLRRLQLVNFVSDLQFIFTNAKLGKKGKANREIQLKYLLIEAAVGVCLILFDTVEQGGRNQIGVASFVQI
jgi:hypothetical protein